MMATGKRAPAVGGACGSMVAPQEDYHHKREQDGPLIRLRRSSWRGTPRGSPGDALGSPEVRSEAEAEPATGNGGRGGKCLYQSLALID